MEDPIDNQQLQQNSNTINNSNNLPPLQGKEFLNTRAATQLTDQNSLQGQSMNLRPNTQFQQSVGNGSRTDDQVDISVNANGLNIKDISDVSTLPLQGASSNSKGKYTRRDQQGIQIKPGYKKHKVTFVDQIQKKPIAEIYIVESYKKYNADESNGASSSCCSIF